MLIKPSSDRGSWLQALVVASYACASEPLPNPTAGTGSVSLNLTAPANLTVKEVSYQLWQGERFIRSGSFVPDQTDMRLDANIGALAPGSGYRMMLDTASTWTGTGGAVRCSASAGFDIMPDATTTVVSPLRCEGMAPPSPMPMCPTIDMLRSLPDHASVGASVVLDAQVDGSMDAATSLTFSWTASVGVVATPSLARTDYRCMQPGTVSVTFTVSNETPACAPDQAQVFVVCETP